MNSEERIRELEQKVEQLQTVFKNAVDVMQDLGGGDRMYQAAVVALMQSHPNPEEMAAAVHHHLEKQFTSIHFETLPESHVQGAESARTWLLAVVKEALRQHRDPL
ncbi:hypothetical protein [Hydrogenophaga sp.]|uniref:hypothetical protein n=1 Tax=Hydrogenophaga sp. TaxID=1904254 RepID=UPI003F6FD22D